MTRLSTSIVATLLLLVGWCGRATAHEVRPAFLQIDERSAGETVVTWKQPTLGDLAVRLVPHLSNGWLDTPPKDRYAGDGYMVTTWAIVHPPGHGLDGVRVDVDGLRNTMTDVVVHVRAASRPDLDLILRPEASRATIPTRNATSGSRLSFLWLGVRHIMGGPDHLLFVLGLILIVPGRAALLRTVTAFTLAHSVTLAMATLDHLNLSTTLLDCLVALSILFLAPEVMRARAGGDSLTVRMPWLVAFIFGLLHGLGFSTGLSALGLAKADLAGALVLFNLGVEIGQLAFIGVVLGLVHSFELMEIRWSRPVRLIPTYAIGGLGAFWALQNAALLLNTAP